MHSTMECLTEWMTRQRWYAGKGRVPQLVEVHREDWPCDEPDASIRVLLLRDTASTPPSLYHVPIVARTTIPRGAGPAFIGRDEHDDYLFDGPHDPIYVRALLRRLGVTRHDQAGRVHTGEQSNSSIIVDGGSEAPLVAKVFRLVHPGDNPDVVLQTALTTAGNRNVPRMLGSVTAAWTDPLGSESHTDEPVRGHLAFAQEFVPGVRDGWPLALEAAREGEPFTTDAERLGRVTAAVHQALAACLPSREPTLGDIVGFVAGWHQRLAVAISDVPQLRDLRPQIEAVYDAARDAPWPPLQRIHGDFHLGQVLRRPTGEWLIVDFEGEPLRPLSERSRVDSPLRDVAGMLRSFDYAVGSLRRESRAAAGAIDTASLDLDALALEAERAEWARMARAAFLDGYIAASGLDLRAHRALLDAFELDKAVYEAMYEARNRPGWLPIPLAAVAYLVSSSRAAKR
ncbi:maltokinase N-terminal cap-like domain-containing protein [Microcella frigidaquae]|uniref:Maltokinase n=1 Tax=Microcella frigidaquae TaxID=424758 RepID=A0A840X9I5_9MICO|nr:phosphotransferase [Microcella frigidaquae]MBB5618891.1 putative trehalose synthase [Microcella frigidaquae]NHN44992.1 phosphotransferase [Microcella frigidaquae]